MTDLHYLGDQMWIDTDRRNFWFRLPDGHLTMILDAEVQHQHGVKFIETPRGIEQQPVHLVIMQVHEEWPSHMHGMAVGEVW